jgi:hypothetical protein
MNNALLAEIRLAYLTQNLRPIRRFFCVHDQDGDFACPLVALAIHHGFVERSDPGIEIDGGANVALDWAARTFGEDWTIGFLDGFDGQQESKPDQEYLDGYALGLAAALQLCPCDPPV